MLRMAFVFVVAACFQAIGDIRQKRILNGRQSYLYGINTSEIHLMIMIIIITVIITLIIIMIFLMIIKPFHTNLNLTCT